MDFARAEFNNEIGLFRFGTDDPQDCAARLMKLMSDNGIVPSSFKIGTATLDEVYQKVVAGYAN